MMLSARCSIHHRSPLWQSNPSCATRRSTGKQRPKHRQASAYNAEGRFDHRPIHKRTAHGCGLRLVRLKSFVFVGEFLLLRSTGPAYRSVVVISSAFCIAELESNPTIECLFEDDELCDSRSNGPAFCEHLVHRGDRLEAGLFTELREEICRL